ncbi:MAG: hypothetical protein JWR15_3676, partial [Prosthecobacter sp.]|nr:hypothetical protein [Prosthecobacter sp.]
MKRFLLLQVTLAFAVLAAAEDQEPTNFIRFVEEEASDSLQTA